MRIKVGDLVRHEGLLQHIGIITKICDKAVVTVYFICSNEVLPVFIDDLELICNYKLLGLHPDNHTDLIILLMNLTQNM